MKDRATVRIPRTKASVTPQPMMQDDDFEPILIVGHQRSGTTLLATILNRHSQVAVPPELNFFHRAFRGRRRGGPGRHPHGFARLRAVDSKWQQVCH